MIEAHVEEYLFPKLYTVEFSEKLVIKAAVIKTAHSYTLDILYNMRKLSSPLWLKYACDIYISNKNKL